MKRHKKFFSVADAASRTSTHPRAHIAAVITKKNTILAIGVNSEKSHPKQMRHNAKRGFGVDIRHGLHAEIAALLKTDEDLTGASIYVFRRNKVGETAMCRPCAACEDALRKRGVRHIHYTNERGLVYEDWC